MARVFAEGSAGLLPSADGNGAAVVHVSGTVVVSSSSAVCSCSAVVSGGVVVECVITCGGIVVVCEVCVALEVYT